MSLSLAWGIDDTVTVNNNEYALNLEFSRVLRWYEMWRDPDLLDTEKLVFAIQLITGISTNEIPHDDMLPLTEAIVHRIIGNQEKIEPVRDHAGNVLEDKSARVYDIEEDSPYIYASFLMDYNIDLIEAKEKKNLHWDKFNALLAGLSENTKFKRVLEIRQMKIPPKATPEEAKKIKDAKQAVALKSSRAQIEFEMMDLKQQREYMLKQQQQGRGGGSG